MNGCRVVCLVAGIVFSAGLLHLAVRLHEVQVETAADYNYASFTKSALRPNNAA